MPTGKTVERSRKRFDPFPALIFLLVLGLTVLLGRTLWQVPEGPPGLEEEVSALMHRSGVTSPVTAVLLNFRGYDTLLEVMVLFLAVVGVWSLTTAPLPEEELDASPVQFSAVRLITPLMCLVAAFLVWQGSSLAGGAFQGGAVLAGVGVILLITNLPWLREIPSLPLRLGFTIGPAVFLAVALWCLAGGGALLAFPERFAGALLLCIETACAVSIGLALSALFAGGRPVREFPEESDPTSETRKGKAQ